MRLRTYFNVTYDLLCGCTGSTVSSEGDQASVAALIAWLLEHTDEDGGDDEEAVSDSEEESLPDLKISSGSSSGSDFDSDDLASIVSLEPIQGSEVPTDRLINTIFQLKTERCKTVRS